MDINFDNNYWSDLKVKLKCYYPQLTHADFVVRDGAAEEMLIQIANKLVISRKEFNEVIDGL